MTNTTSLFTIKNVKGPVTVIGGANMDINGFSRDPLNMEDSNPGTVEYCPGGVGRNIAENLYRLGAEVRFISVIGDDPGGQLLKTSSAQMGLNIEHSLFIENPEHVTSVYIALMDSNGEMKLALADMEILEQITVEHLESKAGIIKESAIVVLDANLPDQIIRFLLDRFGSSKGFPGSFPSQGPLFFYDGVSARKAPRAASCIGSFDTLKLGNMEAAVLSGIPLSNYEFQEKLKETADWFISQGTRRVFVTLGKEGVYTACPGKCFFTPVRYLPPVNTSGGGDAFTAGIVYGTLQNWDEETIVYFSLAMAGITVQSKFTVSPEMSLELVQKSMV